MPIPDAIRTFINAQAHAAPGRFDDLRLVIFNGTLKRSPETSHTDGLLEIPVPAYGTRLTTGTSRSPDIPTPSTAANRRPTPHSPRR
jgi:hypothetical protein